MHFQSCFLCPSSGLPGILNGASGNRLQELIDALTLLIAAGRSLWSGPEVEEEVPTGLVGVGDDPNGSLEIIEMAFEDVLPPGTADREPDLKLIESISHVQDKFRADEAGPRAGPLGPAKPAEWFFTTKKCKRNQLSGGKCVNHLDGFAADNIDKQKQVQKCLDAAKNRHNVKVLLYF
jgi:hypothetical protein